MMTNPTTSQESARQVLGKAIRFFREQRHMDQRNLADRVGCSIGDLDDWERGKSAPPDNRWGRLCKMLHSDLSNMRATWQRARAEDEQVRAASSVASAPLTSKPFANLATITPIASARPPETLHDDGFDLRPAYKAVTKLPKGWNTLPEREKRRTYAIEMVKTGMTDDEVYKQVRLKFGVGIEKNVIVTLREEVQRAAVEENRRKLGLPPPAPAPAPKPAKPAPPPPEPPKEALNVETKPPEPAPAKAGNDIEGAVRLILEAIPNLKSFKIEVAENGEIDVSHTIREVRVVETTGSLKLRKP